MAVDVDSSITLLPPIYYVEVAGSSSVLQIIWEEMLCFGAPHIFPSLVFAFHHAGVLRNVLDTFPS